MKPSERIAQEFCRASVDWKNMPKSLADFLERCGVDEAFESCKAAWKDELGNGASYQQLQAMQKLDEVCK